MGKILLIEDDGLLTRDLRITLEEEYKHEVTTAYNCFSAMAQWVKHDGRFDCIILDLNIHPYGLDAKTMDYYFPIIGMWFLDEICIGKTSEEKAQIWGKTIIYSGYIIQLQSRKKDFEYYHLLRIIPKNVNSINKLFDSVSEIVSNPLNLYEEVSESAILS